jgi:hypothetical protein
MTIRISRRGMLQTFGAGIFGLACKHRCDALFAAPLNKLQANNKRCVVLWMDGGPSQMETFDPKPSTSTGGPTESISTSVPGIAIAKYLPKIATKMEHFSILRSLTSPEGDHDRGSHLLHTGYPQVPAFPRPTLGSVVSHESPTADHPLFVSVGSRGFGPAYMGPEHAPFTIEDPNTAVSQLRELTTQRSWLRKLDSFNQVFDEDNYDQNLARRKSSIARIERLLSTSFVQALNVEKSPTQDLERYGDSTFGRRCLLAKRLLDSGVRFVEIAHGGWDTHDDNFNSVARLCTEIDGPWNTLIEDLQASGLWDETVVLWMGEFGRTPQINANSGRDHFPKVTPVVVGGGGLRGGQVIGQTNKLGLEIDGPSYTVPDLFATLLSTLGIDPNHQFQNEFGAIAPASDNGKIIASLI